MNVRELKKVANQVRKNIVTEVYYAKAGHPGGSLSAADIYTYLYMEEMNVDPAKPADPDRDRFVLSKGHTCPGLYGVMAEKGYFDREECKTFRHLGARLQGHPSMHYLPGIDMKSCRTRTTASTHCWATANWRKARYGRPPCSQERRSWTTCA